MSGAPGAVPDDPKLPFLARALDRAEMEPRLARLLAPAGAPPPRIALEAARLVRHKPGRRCLIDYALRVGDPPTPRALLGKCRARGADLRTLRVVQALRRAGLDGREGVLVPAAVGALPELGMWLQEKVAGEAAWSGLAGPEGEALASRIADALHRLHTAAVEAPRRHDAGDELRILAERLRALAEQRPAWSERLERLLAACRRLAAGLPAAPPCGIHRDFYPDQVIVNGARLALIDLDLYCAGDPALDAGNLSAHLAEWALRSRGDAGALADRERAFEERFLERSGAGRRGAVRAWTTLALARLVPLGAGFPERRPFGGALLELCEERLGLPARAPAAGARARAAYSR